MIRVLRDFKWGNVGDPQKMRAGNIQKVPGGVSERMLAEWLKLGWVEVYTGPTVEKAMPKVEYVATVEEATPIKVRIKKVRAIEESDEAGIV
jgi:DNA-binding HxlR family transcriptional regulator